MLSASFLNVKLAEAEIRDADLHVASARVNAAMMLSSVPFDTTTLSPASTPGVCGIGGIDVAFGRGRDCAGWRDRDRDRERRVDVVMVLGADLATTGTGCTGEQAITSIQAEPSVSTSSCAAMSSM